jgi:hypothetical protein
MGAPTSSMAGFKGTRAPRGGRPPRGRLLLRPGMWRPAPWVWVLAGLAALVAALVVLFPGGARPSAPRPPRVAVTAPGTPAFGAPSVSVPSIPGLGAPRLSAPQVSGPTLHAPHLSPPAISAPDIPVPDVGGPQVGGADVGIGTPHSPDLHGPSFHISFAWLLDLCSICWRILVFFMLIPWRVILAALILGRWLWLLARRRKESDDGDRGLPG